MENSLFTPLLAEGLTTLQLRHDWKTGGVRLFAAREWDETLSFARYNSDFSASDIPCADEEFCQTAQVRQMFVRHGLGQYLDEVLDLIRKGRHIGIDCFFNRRQNIRYMGCIHSRTLGINNRSHAIISGGIRRHGFDDTELDVIIDGLNLGRAMSYKNVAAGIPYGGCKSAVHMDPLDIDNMEQVGFLAFCIDRIRCFTGPDMRFPTALADVCRQKKYSVQFTGGPEGPLGPTGTPTAYGCYLAMKQAALFRFGDASLAGRSIAVQGLGAVGWHMCGHLLAEGARLLVADIDGERAGELIKHYPLGDITVVPPGEILNARADFLCPCAMGGIMHEENIPNLMFKVILGPANNQLRAVSREQEEKLAALLDERGILFQIDWWHNTGGVLAGAEEYEHGQGASHERLKKRIEATVPVKTWENLCAARDRGITPTRCAYETCEARVYGEIRDV